VKIILLKKQRILSEEDSDENDENFLKNFFKEKE